MANYKIQFDRDGSPYISHAWGARASYNRSAPVKYIAKILNNDVEEAKKKLNDK